MAPKGVQRNGKGCSHCRLGRGCCRASSSGWSIAWASTDLRRAHRPAARRTSSRDAARVRAGVDNDLTFMCAGKYTSMSASTYILCAFQDHLHPRAAAVAHVHDAYIHTQTQTWAHLPLERHNYLRRVRTQGGTLFTSSGVFLCMLGLSFSCFSISSISLLLLLHFMNYEMCNFYTATDFLRVFHRSQCARHLPQALAHSQLQSHPSPLQKFHSLPHGVALESQLLWPICASLCSLLRLTHF